MRRLRKPDPLTIARSTNSLLELVGRDSDPDLRAVLIGFRDLLTADMAWADGRKQAFRRRSAMVKVAILALTVFSTVVLGIAAIPARASIALPAVALVTALTTLESFFSWRSRWVLMEELQYRLNHVRDKLDHYLVATPRAELSADRLSEFFAEQQATWAYVSRQQSEFRRQYREPRATQPNAGDAGILER